MYVRPTAVNWHIHHFRRPGVAACERVQSTGVAIYGPSQLTAREKPEKKRRKAQFMTILINGKQKCVRRPPTIDGISVDEFILRNADPIWLHQNEMWELIDEAKRVEPGDKGHEPGDGDLPF